MGKGWEERRVTQQSRGKMQVRTVVVEMAAGGDLRNTVKPFQSDRIGT